MLTDQRLLILKWANIEQVLSFFSEIFVKLSIRYEVSKQ